MGLASDVLLFSPRHNDTYVLTAPLGHHDQPPLEPKLEGGGHSSAEERASEEARDSHVAGDVGRVHVAVVKADDTRHGLVVAVAVAAAEVMVGGW